MKQKLQTEPFNNNSIPTATRRLLARNNDKQETAIASSHSKQINKLWKVKQMSRLPLISFVNLAKLRKVPECSRGSLYGPRSRFRSIFPPSSVLQVQRSPN